MEKSAPSTQTSWHE